MKKGYYPLLTILLTLIPAALNAQQCAPSLQWPRWVWHDDLEFVSYLGSDFDIDIENAGYGWQVQTQNWVAYTPSMNWEDLIFEYASLPDGIIGNTIPHTQMDNQPCYLKTDYCGICMNAGVF
jgi:hypothetical protein